MSGCQPAPLPRSQGHTRVAALTGVVGEAGVVAPENSTMDASPRSPAAPSGCTEWRVWDKPGIRQRQAAAQLCRLSWLAGSEGVTTPAPHLLLAEAHAGLQHHVVARK
jgi:hypothetical protein